MKRKREKEHIDSKILKHLGGILKTIIFEDRIILVLCIMILLSIFIFFFLHYFGINEFIHIVFHDN